VAGEKQTKDNDLACGMLMLDQPSAFSFPFCLGGF
jgi:hypothetical protein